MSIYPPTGTLEIKNATLKIPVVDLQYTSNTAKLEANSNVVTEFSRSKKLIKYPRVALNSASQDGYVVTASTDAYDNTFFHRYDPFRPFVSGSANGWHSGPPHTSTANSWDQTFDTSGYNKDITSYGVGGYAGTSIAGIESEWLKLELPHKIVLSHLFYQHRDGQSVNYHQAPKDFRILGSNDDIDWDTIKIFTGQTSHPEGQTLTAEATKGYKYLAFVVTATQTPTGTSGLTLKNLEYYGVPEYDPEAHGTDVTVNSYPNVPNTDWLEVYYDAKGETTMPNPVTDLAGGDQDASVYGVTLDTTNEAFVFNGSSYLETDIPQITTGVWPFTMSFWFKLNAHIGSTWNYLAHLGIRGTHGDSTLVGLKNDRIAITTWGDSQIVSSFVPVPGVWYHVTSTWPGGPFYDNAKLYINAVSYGDSSGTRDETSPLSFPTSENKLTLGKQMNTTSDYFDGSIANFRLFNRALTSDEIYQLYAYQKEYFGHGDLSMTLKAGRLGIGTSEPRGALDVRGDAYYGCPVFFTAYYGNSGTNNNIAAESSPNYTTLVFNYTMVNKGGAYNLSTGRCTFPISGYYEVLFRGGSASTAGCQTWIFRNGVAPTTWTASGLKSVGAAWDGSSGTFRNLGIIHFFDYFEAGEYLDVRIVNGSFNASNYNSFSVKYLSN